MIASRQSRHHVRRLTPKACNQLAGPLSSGYVDEKSRCCPAAASPRKDLADAVALFHGLSDRTRLAIVRHLAHGEARVVDLTRMLGLPQSTVSSHLACLRDCGLIVGRPEGGRCFTRWPCPNCWTYSPPRKPSWR
ncbi:bacterial regulatory, arsR family protein [Mycobacterium xenopi 4042]|uniref:Bacterial regulatory, arsR family protein n=1 Tax=Mycobacterium xenopi 4042 TaxID=1299334 RepID=X8BDW3_MYCXE|nr:bacterial regulatory, arsR family protein [Mycobacterium xenopi 4042]